MISDYVDKEDLLFNLKEYFIDPDVVNWDQVLRSGVEVKGYYAYFVPFEPCLWFLTDPMTGVVQDMLIGVEDIYAAESEGVLG